MPRRALLGLAAVAGLALFAAGCGQQMRAERDGRDLAESLCDLRNADDVAAADEALEDINEQLDDLSRRFGVSTAEDRADVDENLADLASAECSELRGVASPTAFGSASKKIERSQRGGRHTKGALPDEDDSS